MRSASSLRQRVQAPATCCGRGPSGAAATIGRTRKRSRGPERGGGTRGAAWCSAGLAKWKGTVAARRGAQQNAVVASGHFQTHRASPWRRGWALFARRPNACRHERLGAQVRIRRRFPALRRSRRRVVGGWSSHIIGAAIVPDRAGHRHAPRSCMHQRTNACLHRSRCKRTGGPQRLGADPPA